MLAIIAITVLRTFLSSHAASAFFLDTRHFYCRLGLSRHRAKLVCLWSVAISNDILFYILILILSIYPIRYRSTIATTNLYHDYCCFVVGVLHRSRSCSALVLRANCKSDRIFTTFLGYLVFFKLLDTLLERALGKRIEFRFGIALQFAELDFG